MFCVQFCPVPQLLAHGTPQAASAPRRSGTHFVKSRAILCFSNCGFQSHEEFAGLCQMRLASRSLYIIPMKHYSLSHICVKDDVFRRLETECGQGAYQKRIDSEACLLIMILIGARAGKELVMYQQKSNCDLKALIWLTKCMHVIKTQYCCDYNAISKLLNCNQNVNKSYASARSLLISLF